MRKCLLLVYALTIFSVSISSAQLSGAALALYNEAFNHDSVQVNFALSQGAQILATPDSNSFYIKWFPTGATPSATPLIVALHGSDGYAFSEFHDWFAQAQLHGCGIISLQWFRGTSSVAPNDYFTDTAIYSYIDSALTRFNYPSGKAFLHGFSRGAARSYALVFLDSHGGHDYFCTTLSNSGSAEPGYPLYAQIISGAYGTNVFAGKQWVLFCGGLDPNPTMSGCIGMNNTQTWLQSEGASVGIFIQDAGLGHGGFHTVPTYIDSVLNYYLSCYNGTLSLQEQRKNERISVFPNPCRDHISIHIEQNNFNKHSFTITNIAGQLLFSTNDNNAASTYTKTIDLSFIPPGAYLLKIDADGVRENKLIIRQ